MLCSMCGPRGVSLDKVCPVCSSCIHICRGANANGCKFHNCEWFALCENPAVKRREHPVLGPVPICQRCDDKIEAMA